MDLIIGILTFLVTLTYLSTFEWAVHRFPMHMKKLGKPWWLPLFRYLYKNHTVEHHGDFLPDDYEKWDDHHHDITLLKPLLFLGFMLIGTATLPVWCIDYLTDYRFHLTWYCVPMATLYYVMFETIHVAEHKPKSFARLFMGNTWFFAFLQEHHQKHHEKWGVNFNLVCPIADYLFGTLYTKK